MPNNIEEYKKAHKVFILGFTKCATTSIYDNLAIHPDISTSHNKEPHYYFSKYQGVKFNGPADQDIVDQMFITDYKEYIGLYDHKKTILDGSAMTIECSEALQELATLDKSKFILVVRDPIERSISAFKHMNRDVRENLTFSNALKREQEIINENWLPIWHYKECSMYPKKVSEARALFGDRLLVVKYEDYLKDHKAVMRAITKHIDVTEVSWPNNHSNRSGVPKSPLLQKIIMRKSFLKKLFVTLTPRFVSKKIKSKILEKNIQKFDFEVNEHDKKIIEKDYRKQILETELSKEDRNVLSY